MRSARYFLSYYLFFALLLMACTPRTGLRHKETSHEKCPPLTIVKNDTIAYTISFSDLSRRNDFIESLRKFLERYPFAQLRRDSVTGQVLIRIAPVESPGGKGSSLELSPVEPVSFSSGGTTPAPAHLHTGISSIDSSAAQSPEPFDTIIPVPGGKLRLHMPISASDGMLLPLIASNPFGSSDSSAEPILTIVETTSRKITLRINGRQLDGKGRIISALDLIDIWSGYVKKHPAEGIAIFGNVEGIADFIAGREAVIRGMGAADNKTVFLRFSRPDTTASERIKTPRLLGSIHAGLGIYYPAVVVGKDELILVPNVNRKRRFAYLDTLIITASEDNNPILSFSLRKYDALILTLSSDVSYAASNLEKQASLYKVSNDRYFIACAIDDKNVRGYIASQIDPAELLGTVVKANGKPIPALESDSAPFPVFPQPSSVSSHAGRQIRILFRKDDMVSERIASKLFADLSTKGVRAVLYPATVTEYERTIVERNYECAVGYVSDAILKDPAERLRLAAVWFDDDTDEKTRIETYREIPLFSIDRYLLIRKPAGLYSGRIEGIYASYTRPD